MSHDIDQYVIQQFNELKSIALSEFKNAYDWVTWLDKYSVGAVLPQRLLSFTGNLLPVIYRCSHPNGEERKSDRKCLKHSFLVRVPRPFHLISRDGGDWYPGASVTVPDTTVIELEFVEILADMRGRLHVLEGQSRLVAIQDKDGSIISIPSSEFVSLREAAVAHVEKWIRHIEHANDDRRPLLTVKGLSAHLGTKIYNITLDGSIFLENLIAEASGAQDVDWTLIADKSKTKNGLPKELRNLIPSEQRKKMRLDLTKVRVL